jgi:integrase
MSKDFFLVRPNQKQQRASFAILERRAREKSKSLKLEQLDAINKAFKSKQLAFVEAEEQCKDLIKKLYKDQETKVAKIYNSDNLALLSKFWEEHFIHRNQKSPKGSYGYFRRAIEALGTTSIYTATPKELAKAAASLGRGNPQRRIAWPLNRLLEYIDREQRIALDKRNFTEVKFLTEAEYERVRVEVPDESTQKVADAAFYTGARLGELFALKSSSFRQGASVLWISTQMREDGTEDALKNNKPHLTFIVPEGAKRVRAWVEGVPTSEKLRLRNLRHAEIFREACIKVFPNSPEKWASIHDLRHAYAINLLSKGASVNLVAQCLGDSIQVVQDYYTGYILSDEGVGTLKKLFK